MTAASSRLRMNLDVGGPPVLAPLVRPAAMALVVIGLALLTAVLLVQSGPLVASLPAASLAGAVALRHPRVILAILVIATVILENDPYGPIPETSRFYRIGPPSPIEVLTGLLAMAVAFRCILERRRLRLPEPLTIPLLFLVLAALAGGVMAYFADVQLITIAESMRPFIYLTVLPVLVVNVLDDQRDVAVAAAFAGVLAIYKAAEGTLVSVLGLGRELGDATISYYEPTANYVILLFAFAVVGAFLMRVSLPWWANLGFPLAAAALVLSYRRSFWVAAAVGLVVMVALTSAVRGRRLIVPAAILAGAVLMMSGFPTGMSLQGPVGERIQSLDPQRLAYDTQDRYRIDEFRNVWEEIKLHPVTGIGLVVPWQIRHPIAIGRVWDDSARGYSHVAVLFFWLKLGLLGVFAYAALMAGGLLAAFRVWTSQLDPGLRAAGLGCVAGIVGLIVVEMTSTWTGADYRFNILFPLVLGWLAATERAARIPAEGDRA